MYSEPNYFEQIPRFFKQIYLHLMYLYDPYMIGLHPERKNYPQSYESFLANKQTPEIIKRTAIRKNHEYFLYCHISNAYEESFPEYFSETLWKAKQFQFRAATDDDFGYCDVFKDHMLTKYIPSRKNILDQKELQDIRDFVDKAKPEDFLIMDPDTKRFVQYNPRTLNRLRIYVRDTEQTLFFRTHFVGILPYFPRLGEKKSEWYINILDCVE